MGKKRMKVNRGAGRRPKTDKTDGDTRVAILAAARRIFAQRGIDGTSVRAVAEAAQVNNAMIYYHFKDKDDLYRSMLADSFTAVADIWNDPLFKSHSPVKTKIQQFIAGYIRFHQGNEDLRRIMAMEFAGSGGNITWVCENFFADNFLQLTKLFRQGMRTGELRKIDPSTAAASLIVVIIHNFIMQPIAEHFHGKRTKLSPGKFGKFVTDLFFDGLGKK